MPSASAEGSATKIVVGIPRARSSFPVIIAGAPLHVVLPRCAVTEGFRDAPRDLRKEARGVDEREDEKDEPELSARHAEHRRQMYHVAGGADFVQRWRPCLGPAGSWPSSYDRAKTRSRRLPGR